jgi:hypothetical protein
VAGILAFILLLVWEQVTATRLGYRVEQARAAVQRQEHQNAYLRQALQRWKAPGHLSEAARRRLGMVPASPDSVVLLPAASLPPRTPLWTRLLARTED